METKTLRATICGHVQGVGFRFWTQEEALKRNLQGWVRNHKDGSVEALFHGAERQVDDMIRACRHGPEMARVDKITTEPADFSGTEDFTQEPTV